MVHLGILGAGPVGQSHLECLSSIKSAHIAGVYDPDESNRQFVQDTFGVTAFPTVDALLAVSDALDIVTPTNTHAELASRALRASKHLFIDQPVVQSLEEARLLSNLAQEANMLIQVGHSDRFNPAFMSYQSLQWRPKLMEAQRQVTPEEGKDLDLLFDLMLHDIDLMLALTRSNVSRVSAVGVHVNSHEYNAIHARLEFDNGSVANLLAGRMAKETTVQSRYYQREGLVLVDFLEGKMNVEFPFEKDHKPRKSEHKADQLNPGQTIQHQLEVFMDAITAGKQPPVTLEDGIKALKVAHQIKDHLEHRHF